MAQDDKQQPDWLSLNRDLFGAIIGLIAVVTAIVGFVRLWQGDAKLVTIVLVAVGVGVSLVLCRHVRFKKKASRFEPAIEVYAFRPGMRLAALVGLVGIVPLSVALLSGSILLGDLFGPTSGVSGTGALEITAVPPATPTATPGVESPTAAPTATATPVPDWLLLRTFPAPGSDASGIVRVADSLWVAVPCDDRIYRLDLEGNIIDEIDMPEPGCGPREVGLAWDGESLWGAWWSRVVQLDPNTGQTLAEFEVDMDVRGIAWDGSALWMMDMKGNLVRYDRAGHRLRRLAIPVSSPSGLAWVEGELWVVDVFGKLTRFDSEFAQLGLFSLSEECGVSSFLGASLLALYWDGESLWLADSHQERILQCEPAE